MQIQYSPNCEDLIDMNALCQVVAREIIELGFYPLGGLRVRAARQDYLVIADGHADNAFVDMVFRIGKGRTPEQRKQTGEKIFAAVKNFLGDALNNGHFMLSLEIVEIESDYSWKANSIHGRLNK